MRRSGLGKKTENGQVMPTVVLYLLRYGKNLHDKLNGGSPRNWTGRKALSLVHSRSGRFLSARLWGEVNSPPLCMHFFSALLRKMDCRVVLGGPYFN